MPRRFFDWRRILPERLRKPQLPKLPESHPLSRLAIDHAGRMGRGRPIDSHFMKVTLNYHLMNVEFALRERLGHEPSNVEKIAAGREFMDRTQINANVLRAVDYSARQARDYLFTLPELVEAGYTKRELIRDAEFPKKEVEDAFERIKKHSL